jgi:toxin ParE1/3/4
MRVVFADAARHDLVEIARYFAWDNPARARIVSKRLRDCACDLALHPEAFARNVDPVDTGLRRRVVDSYVIVYCLKGDQVEVARVLHAARDIARILNLPD